MKTSKGRAYGLHLRPRRTIALDKTPVDQWTWRPADPAAATFSPDVVPAALDDVARTNYRPSNRRQKVVLVFETGVLSRGILSALRQERLKFFYLDFDAFQRQGQVAFEAGPGSYLEVGPAKLLFRDVSAVIWTQPMEVLSRTSTANASRHLRRQRWMQVLRELRGVCPADAIWMPSHPLNGSNDFQDKLRECRLAAEAGFAVPETLLTNSPDQARAFVEKWRGSVVFKEFSQARVPFVIRLVSPGDPRLDDVRHSPCAFQQFVPKEFDVRAVVIGKRIFAVRIDSQASASSKLDWRVYDNQRVAWSQFRLPRKVEGSMLRLMRKLELNWASFDLVKSIGGPYYFLELNRPGASYWLKPFAGLDVPAEVVRFLREELRPRPASKNV